MPPCRPITRTSSLKRPRVVPISQADTRNVTVFSPYTNADAPRSRSWPAADPANSATSWVPRIGPMKLPRCRPIATCPFAQGRSCSPTRFGIDAPATAQTGASRIAVTDATATSCPGVRAKASATKPAAAQTSETTSTVRRSNRSPSQLTSGWTSPCIPVVSSKVSDSQAAEPPVSR
jgi:hypothetical protein